MNADHPDSVYYPSLCLILAILAIVSFFGCAGLVRTEYQRPALDLPGQWASKTHENPMGLPGGRWWTVFKDPVLDDLIARALETNNDLAVATIKVRKARLKAGLEAAGLTPDFSMGLNTGKTKDLSTGAVTNTFGSTTGLSWEADLWGKLAASRDAAHWEARATEQDRANTALSLVGTTADLYWQIAYLNQAIQTSRENMAYTCQTLDLLKVKYQAGGVSELDVLKAEQDVESQKADLADLKQQLAEARNALAILFDQAPGPIMTNPPHLVDMPLPALAPGIPAEVLGNRPDLKAAEFRLRSILADTDATRASYYPNLTLTSQLGTSSETLIRLLENPVTTLGAGLTLPFVQWNTTRLNIRIAQEEYTQAVTEFRQTLYHAFEDVENALSAHEHYKERNAALARFFMLAKKAEAMAEVRYKAGNTSIQDWLDQQENRRTAELSLAKNRYNQLTNLMTLYLAIGGDRDLVEPVPE